MPFPRFSFYLVYASIVSLLVGCAGGPKLTEVSGKLTLDGEPLDGVQVIFVPDAEFGGKGRISTGLTDADGNYKQTYSAAGRQPQKPGVAAGKVRVYLIDVKASESAREQDGEGEINPIDVRFDFKFLDIQTSPLRFDVISGGQTIDIELSDY